MVVQEEPRNESQPTAEYVAMRLREEISNGELKPGTSLKEIQLAQRFNVSRNTLRGALRQLQYMGLVTLVSNKSATVAVMDENKIHDIYRVRRVLEKAGIEASVNAQTERLRELRDSVNASQTLHDAQHWKQFGTASLMFHHEIVALLDSPLLDQYFADILAQTRLIFAGFTDQGELQKRWLEPDRRLADLIASGNRLEACAYLNQYLDDSEAMVIDSIRQQSFAAHR
jgi:DNA-binding GntR family transcriptional regulator